MITIGVAVLLGIALSLRFNVFVLITAVLMMLLGTTVAEILEGDRPGSAALTAVLMANALQIGFLAGVVARAVSQNWGAHTVAQRGDQSPSSKSKILDFMEVVGSDDCHVGTVDHTEDCDCIMLAKDDPMAGGRAHLISTEWVAYVDDKIHLDRPSYKAMAEWKAAA
jgi:hypothetical protein